MPRKKHDRKRKLVWSPPPGQEPVGLMKQLAREETITGKWRLVELRAQNVYRTEVQILELVEGTMLLSELTFHSLDVSRTMPWEERVKASIDIVIPVLERVWLEGVDPFHPDLDMEFGIWSALEGLYAIRVFRQVTARRNLFMPSQSLIDRKIVVYQKVEVEYYTQTQWNLSITLLARRWPCLCLDEEIEQFVMVLRDRAAMIVMNGFTEDIGVMDDPSSSQVGKVGELDLLFGNDDFSFRAHAILRDMVRDLRLRRGYIQTFREIRPIPLITDEQAEAASQWVDLRSAERNESASQIVLDRFRASFFHHYRRPGGNDMFVRRYESGVGSSQYQTKDTSYEAVLTRSETVYSFLYDREHKAFTNKFFTSDPQVIVQARNDKNFGPEAYELFFFLGFSHVFEMHVGRNFSSWWMEAPPYQRFENREARRRVLLVRLAGEYFVVDTLNMTAENTTSLPTAIFRWLELWAANENDPEVQRIATQLSENIFDSGSFRLVATKSRPDRYASSNMFPPEMLASIYYQK